MFGIVETVDFSLFESRFKDYGRLDQFSYAGLRALFDYLEELAQDCGQNIELDVIALCCDYSEEPLQDVLGNYDLESLEDLQERTTVIEIGDETIIYGVF